MKFAREDITFIAEIRKVEFETSCSLAFAIVSYTLNFTGTFLLRHRQRVAYFKVAAVFSVWIALVEQLIELSSSLSLPSFLPKQHVFFGALNFKYNRTKVF